MSPPNISANFYGASRTVFAFIPCKYSKGDHSGQRTYALGVPFLQLPTITDSFLPLYAITRPTIFI